MDVSVKFHFVDNSRAVIKAAEEGSDKALRASGAYIRKVARSSIRRRKERKDPKTGRPIRPGSPPGKPPFTYTGHLKRAIRFYVDKREHTVRIGPVNEYAQTIWDRHEFGGTFRERNRKLLRRRTIAMGEIGPIRAAGVGGKVRHIRLKTASQVRRANELIEKVNTARQAKSGAVLNYPPRPFMGPALAKSNDKVASFWSGVVK